MDEKGHVTVLILGCVLILMGVLGVALDGTKAFIHRRTLQNAADAAVLAAAGELDVQAYYASDGAVVKLDVKAARTRVAEWISKRGVTSTLDVRVDSARVTVVLRDTVPSSFLSLVGISEIPVAVEAVAEPLSGAP